MGRAAGATKKARNIVKLRHAARQSEARDELDEVIADLTGELDDTLSKKQAADVIGISVPTLTKWMDRGFIPVEMAQSGRPRVPRDHVLALAEQVESLRRGGRSQHVIAAVVDRMQREHGTYQREFLELFGPGLRALSRGDLVSAAPGPDFGPED